MLVVAYYFPPMGLSGVQRVAKFVKYLPAHGWQPTVLTVEPRGYFAYDEPLLDEMAAAGVEIVRTASWDPTRIFGRQATVQLPSERARRRFAALSQLFFVPDNKVGWMLPALRAGRRLLADHAFDGILSSAPPYTAHLIAARLSRESGVPLLTDFRDDWVGNPRHRYPTGLHRRLHAWLEHRVLRQSRRSLAINAYICEALIRRNERPSFRPNVTVLPQGYDAADFAEATAAPGDGQRLRLVHSGIFYDAQTPDFLLRALARLVHRRPALRSRMEAVFVGLVPDASKALVRSLGVEEMVHDLGYRPHREAVAQLQGADVLWMTIGRQPGVEQISTSKMFEYMGARKPILALVPPGAAQEALQGYGAAWVVAPDDVVAIAEALERLYEQWQAGTLPHPDEAVVQRYDRQVLAGELAVLLDQEAHGAGVEDDTRAK